MMMMVSTSAVVKSLLFLKRWPVVVVVSVRCRFGRLESTTKRRRPIVEEGQPRLWTVCHRRSLSAVFRGGDLWRSTVASTMVGSYLRTFRRCRLLFGGCRRSWLGGADPGPAVDGSSVARLIAVDRWSSGEEAVGSRRMVSVRRLSEGRRWPPVPSASLDDSSVFGDELMVEP